VALTVAGDAFDTAVEYQLFGKVGGTNSANVMGDMLGVTTAIIGDPKNASQVLASTGADIYKGLSKGRSGFDSGGMATVTELTTEGTTFDGATGIESQPDPPLSSSGLPKSLNR
jgi:hypothetical protein